MIPQTPRPLFRTTIIKSVLILGWMALIFSFSHQPPSISDAQSGGVTALFQPLFPGVDSDALTHSIRKIAHFTLYAVLGGLLVWTLFPFTRRAPLYATFISPIYALSDEFHQSFIPGRSAELTDVLIDTAGAATGALILLVLLQKHKKRAILGGKEETIIKGIVRLYE